MSRDLAVVLFSAVLATLNPSLLAATTMMLLLPNPKRLMLGYLLGAYMSSIVSGLIIVYSVHGSSLVRTRITCSARLETSRSARWPWSAHSYSRPSATHRCNVGVNGEKRRRRARGRRRTPGGSACSREDPRASHSLSGPR